MDKHGVICRNVYKRKVNDRILRLASLLYVPSKDREFDTDNADLGIYCVAIDKPKRHVPKLGTNF